MASTPKKKAPANRNSVAGLREEVKGHMASLRNETKSDAAGLERRLSDRINGVATNASQAKSAAEAATLRLDALERHSADSATSGIGEGRVRSMISDATEVLRKEFADMRNDPGNILPGSGEERLAALETHQGGFDAALEDVTNRFNGVIETVVDSMSSAVESATEIGSLAMTHADAAHMRIDNLQIIRGFGKIGGMVSGVIGLICGAFVFGVANNETDLGSSGLVLITVAGILGGLAAGLFFTERIALGDGSEVEEAADEATADNAAAEQGVVPTPQAEEPPPPAPAPALAPAPATANTAPPLPAMATAGAGGSVVTATEQLVATQVA